MLFRVSQFSVFLIISPSLVTLIVCLPVYLSLCHKRAVVEIPSQVIQHSSDRHQLLNYISLAHLKVFDDSLHFSIGPSVLCKI